MRNVSRNRRDTEKTKSECCNSAETNGDFVDGIVGRSSLGNEQGEIRVGLRGRAKNLAEMRESAQVVPDVKKSRPKRSGGWTSKAGRVELSELWEQFCC
jgi:hypothetical protein